MATVKSISAADVQKLIAQIERTNKLMREKADLPYPQSFMAIGVAEAGFEHLIKQLKGEYPI